MGVGPILLFDKSTLESLSVDETVWFDQLYYPNITPLFFVETLADLEKEVAAGRTPEQVVGNLAEKTPTGGHVNVYHETLCVGELLGKPIEMRHVAIVSGGKPVRTGGQRGVVFDEAPEVAALRRWEEGRFLETEREFARSWRQALSALDLDAVYSEGRAIIDRLGRPKDLAGAKVMATALLDKPGSRYTRGVLESFKVPQDTQREIIARWTEQGRPPIKTYAPYTAHVGAVDVFFSIALGAELIGRERPSNKVDMAYLYYLPFCMGFTSGDRLHARTAPLFMDDSQVFVSRDDLKAEMAKLDAYYSAQPAEVKERGVMSFAHYPPVDGDFLTSRLWDRLMAPGWREQALRPEPVEPPAGQRDLVARMQQMSDAARSDQGDFDLDSADAVLFQRNVPFRRGKWRLLPPEVEAKAGDSRPS